MEKTPRGVVSTRDDIFASQQKIYTCQVTNSDDRYIKNTGHCGVITFYQILKYAFFTKLEQFKYIFFSRNFFHFPDIDKIVNDAYLKK